MAVIDTNRLREEFLNAEIPLTDEQVEKFSTYADLLVEKNEVMNLTTVTDSEGIIVKHFEDSCLALRMVMDVPRGAKVIDVGAGAGFPSIPMKIVRDDLEITLLDKLNKRVKFLQEVSDALCLGATCIHSRAEDGARTELRESFDIAVARAVAKLPVLLEYCLPYLKVGGQFLAFKGPNCDGELDESYPVIRRLGGKLSYIVGYSLNDEFERTLIIIEKIAPTGNEWPRRVVK